MSKTSGLGDNFYVAGYDLSGDTSALSKVSGGPQAIDMTGIDKSAPERFGGVRDGGIDWASWFNPAAGQAHPVLSALPTTDVTATYFCGTALGNPAACEVAKQLNYDGTRQADGSFPLAVQSQANGYGLQWGVQLTAGKRTDTAAANGTGVDTTASASFGGQAFLQVFSFSGTDATVSIEDSADNITFAAVSGGLSFTQITTNTPTAQRITTSSTTTTVRRYVRAVTATTGGFTSLVFAVALVKNTTATVF